MQEVDSIAELEVRVASARGLHCAVVQGLDLRPFRARLVDVTVEGAFFLGCRMEPDAVVDLWQRGAVVFPSLDDKFPFSPHRPSLYTVDELMAGTIVGKPGSFYEDSYDSKIYRHYQRFRSSEGPVPVLATLAQRLHDHAIDDALGALLSAGGTPRRVVGIMGGHSMERADPRYAVVAEVARELTRAGYFIATGGGPGAMEAGNLGASFAARGDADLVAAIEMLSVESDYKQDRYLEVARAVRTKFPGGTETLAIPTWFYGHEPTNVFASHVAKYFANSIREDGLLAIATHGVVYAPGSAGTIQEIFMDATQNHYGVFDVVSPMVFLDSANWTHEKPVYEMLKQLAGTKQYAKMIGMRDEASAIVDFIVAHPPVPYVP